MVQASVLLADAQIAAERLDMDPPATAADLGVEFAPRAVIVLADLSEVAAQVATEAAGVDAGACR